jgi:hypothetical protein
MILKCQVLIKHVKIQKTIHHSNKVGRLLMIVQPQWEDL